MLKIFAISALAAGSSFMILAQSKISGSLQCAKPDPNYVVQVGDRPGHMVALMQQKCTWTKPIEMEGVQSKDDTGTGVSDIRGANAQDRGYDATTMANGDKIFVRSQGTSKMKGQMLDSGEGKWSFGGGTGKFKALKGTGTYKLKGNPDGSAVIDIEGDYSVK